MIFLILSVNSQILRQTLKAGVYKSKSKPQPGSLQFNLDHGFILSNSGLQAEVQSLKGKNLYLIKGPSSEHDEARAQKHDHVTTKLYFVTLTQVILQLMTQFIDNRCQSLAFL